MTEQNPEQGMNSDNNIHEIIDSLDGMPLSAALVAFDVRRASLHDNLSEFAVNMPSIIALETRSTVDLDGVAECFAEILRVMVREEADQTAIINTAAVVMDNETAERSDLMNQLLGEKQIPKFKFKDIEDLITQCIKEAENIEQAIDTIEALYHTDLGNDVNNFVQLVVNKHQHQLDEQHAAAGQTIEIKKDAKEHVFDIAKVALGVTVALALDRFIHK